MKMLAQFLLAVAGYHHAPQAYSTITGVVVGEAGEAIPSAEVALQSWDSWREDQPAPVVRDRVGRQFQGFLGTTDADGRFELTVPTPTDPSVVLRVRPDEFRRLVQVEFGSERDRPPLTEGWNDLGTLVAESAGVVFGQVTTADGGPVIDARVRPEPGASGSAHFPQTRTQLTGEFHLGHMPLGTYSLLVKATGHRSRRDLPVVIRPGQATGPVEVTLRPATLIQGVVTHGDGIPVEGAVIDASPDLSYLPSRMGYSSRGVTDADGGYRMWLDQDVPHDITATAHGFEIGSVRYEPGKGEMDLVLMEAARIRIAVRAAVTGLPIQEFGARIMSGEEAPYWIRQPVKAEPQEKGEMSLPLRTDHRLWQIEAPGYAPQEGEIDPSTDREVVVDLELGSRLRGVVSSSGNPVPGAVVQLALDFTGRSPKYTPVTDWEWVYEDESDLSKFLGRMREARSGARGEFEFVDLPEGTYRLSSTGRDGRFIDVRQVFVPAATVRDIGQLTYTDGARVQGTIKAGGRPVHGAKVFLGTPYLEVCYPPVTTDVAGTYEITGVHPAGYLLVVSGEGAGGRVPCVVEGDGVIRLDVDL